MASIVVSIRVILRALELVVDIRIRLVVQAAIPSGVSMIVWTARVVPTLMLRELVVLALLELR